MSTPADPFRCDGPSCGRSLRRTSPESWVRLAPYTFCSTVCELKFLVQRKRASMMTDKIYKNGMTFREYTAYLDRLGRLPEAQLVVLARTDRDAKNVLDVKREVAEMNASGKRWKAAAGPIPNEIKKRGVHGVEYQSRWQAGYPTTDTSPKVAETPPTPMDEPLPTPVQRAKRLLADLAAERRSDPEPSFSDKTAHIGWATRETIRRTRQRRYEAELREYL